LVKNYWRRKHRNFIKCHDIRLKTIVLEPYLGTLSHVNFATFFVLNARVLELVKFLVDAEVYSDKFLAEQHSKLQLECKASSGARFDFTSASYQHADWSTKHLRDFDINDRFLGDAETGSICSACSADIVPNCAPSVFCANWITSHACSLLMFCPVII
jgi:hypothetical protein